MVGFGIRIGNATDILQNLVDIGFSHRLGVREAAEELRGDLIDALVGALGTQNDGYQELENTAELKLRLYLGHLLTEIFQDICVAFFFSHIVELVQLLSNEGGKRLATQSATQNLALLVDDDGMRDAGDAELTGSSIVPTL